MAPALSLLTRPQTPVERTIRWGATLLSLLFSLLVIAQDEVINNDGALYLLVSDLIDQGEWRAAFARYPWPFFSMLISLTHRVTGLTPEYAAYLLSLLFLASTVLCFIDLVRLLGGNERVQMLAALVILSLPYFNESRSEILRDHGYWFFYLLGLRFLLLHYRHPSLKRGLAWSGAIFASSLFRMEGFIMMALLPLVLLSRGEITWRQRFSAFLQANALSLSLLLLLGLLLLLLAGDHPGRLGEFSDRLIGFWNAVTAGLAQKAAVIRQEILPELSAKYALRGVILLLASILVTKIATVLSTLYSLILLWPRCYSHLSLPRGSRRFLAWAALVNLAILVLFIVPTFFLQARFAMPLGLTLLLLVPFLLDRLYRLGLQGDGTKWSARRFPLLMVLVALMGADGLISLGGYSKQYQLDAAEWIRHNIEKERRIITSESLRFCYYVNRDLPPGQRHSCQYHQNPKPGTPPDTLALYVKRGVVPTAWERYIKQHHLAEARRFENRRHDGILIYRQNRPTRPD